MTLGKLHHSTNIGPYLGVLGGMGPHATADVMFKIINQTNATSDQDHIPLIVRSVPQIPDRSSYIIRGEGQSPLPSLIQGMRELCMAGANCIIIPCNTAHYWYSDLDELCPVPILHIVECVKTDLRQISELKRVGILATRGTLKGEIYQSSLDKLGLKVILPNDLEIANLVMPGITAVKSGDYILGAKLLERAAYALHERGAEAIIMACTEIPLVLHQSRMKKNITLIDSNLSLARAAVKWWNGRNNLIGAFSETNNK